MKLHLFALSITIIHACGPMEKKTGHSEMVNVAEQPKEGQIGEYVVETFEDSKGELWFGTLGKGVARYNGESLEYITKQDGLPDNAVTCIAEDDAGNLWFGTQFGLSKFNGKTFENYAEDDGLVHFRVSSLLIDSKGILWVGTWNGVCRFDGSTFSEFYLPYPEIETTPNPDTKDWVTGIIEDSKGNIWIGCDGYGAIKYNGENFEHHTKKRGLNANTVQALQEDDLGNIWFGMRVAEKDNPDENKRFGKGGAVKFDGDGYTYFPEIEGLHTNGCFEIYKDRSGNIWLSTIENGVYKYDGSTFTNYSVPIAIMCFLEDSNGKMWLGGSGGLYSIGSDGEVTNVTTNGPWK